MSKTKEHTKRFSLILASRERFNLLNTLLDSLANTTVNPDQIEIIIVVDRCDPILIPVIRNLESKYKIINPVFIVRERSEWMHRDYINWAYGKSKGKYVM